MTPDGISGQTRILGLIADPIAQARSPGMINALLELRGELGAIVLLPMHVSAAALDGVISGLRLIQNFSGAIVSMPHKSAIAELLDDLTPEARLVGAVNVIRRRADGRLVGTVLDGEGFVAGVRSAGHEVDGAACLLVGAGGAGAAIAFSLVRHGCKSLRIENRSASKAVALAARVREAFPRAKVEVHDAAGVRYDLAINATSLGMNAEDDLPLSSDVIDRSALVAECVASPETTRLLELARRRGRAVHSGVPMLAAQLELMLEFMRAG